MSTSPSSETSRAQLAAVGLALGLATLTFIVPLAFAMLAATALLAFGAGAKSLYLAHGLDPGSFSAGVYLATLLLLGSGGWQVVHSVKVWRARRHEPPEAQDESESKALAPAKGAPASLAQRPWMLLGAVLLVADLFLVRWEIRGRLDSPDGILAAAILASMVWTTVLIAVLSVRLTGLLWRTLIRGSRRSPYIAGLVTAFSLAISVAAVQTIRSYSRDAIEAASQQNVVTSIDEAPSSDSSLEQIRLALVEFAEPKKTDDDEQPLVKEEVPSTQPQLAAAPAPAADEDPSDRQEPTVGGVAGPGTAGVIPASVPPADSAPATTPPVDVDPAAAAPAEQENPFFALSFGPPFADCVDRLTDRATDGDPIEQHIRRLVGRFRISDHDARAIVIETLVSVCVKKAEDREDLRRYFFRSVTNAARNFMTRHLNGRRTCSIELVPVLDFPDEQNIWHYSDQTEQRAQQAFCELNEMDQALIQARVVRGLKFGQIAEIIGQTESGAAKAFDRALRRLKQKFEKN